MIINRKIVANALRNAVEQLKQTGSEETLQDILVLIKQLEEA